ncbi:hypothetical protein FRZ06_12105 [Anoxybacterium hadale]|uniref:Uncharacterized protein n=1 Tax=Anoxybacterium hadale TaxID=3408580 RepID=A0ACD1ACN7_9FIRM|nr:hypothetical protein FRZ06_12105 [Clostridiales bacterium]
MNGIEKITERIIQNAEQELAEITREAREKAEEIAARYADAARKESREILSRGQGAATERIERLEGVAMLDTRKLELSVKQELLERAFDTALDRIKGLPEKDYVLLLARLAAKASRSGYEEVLLSNEDRLKVGETVVREANGLIPGGGHLTLAEDFRAIKGGLLLRDEDIEINCTLESLIRQLRSEMAGELAGILFD